MSAIGTFGTGVVGVFERTLPPRSRVSYDPGYELALEVQRWFHYRHGINIHVTGVQIRDVTHLEVVMTSGYREVFRPKKQYWEALEPAVLENIREFKGLFKDVLAEMEFTKTT
jgi:hypothetical protein